MRHLLVVRDGLRDALRCHPHALDECHHVTLADDRHVHIGVTVERVRLGVMLVSGDAGQGTVRGDAGDVPAWAATAAVTSLSLAMVAGMSPSTSVCACPVAE